MKKHLPLFLTLLIASFSLGAFVAHAAGYVPLAPLGDGITASTLNNDSTLIATYLGAALKLIIAVGGALAILMAIIAGTKYVAAGISPDAKSNAKSDITNALIGLALILSSYLILNSIDPNLVKLNNFTLAPINVATSTVPYNVQTSSGTACNMSSLTDLTDPLAIRMENRSIDPVVWSDSAISADVQANLNKTKAEVDKLIIALGASNVEVTSAYRNFQYQNHLFEINNKWNGLNGEKNRLKDLNTVAWPGCIPLQTSIGAEYTKHELGGVVANPAFSATHVGGTGVDIKIKGGVELKDINAYMAGKNIKLKWQGLPNDIVHFNYGNPQ